MKLSRRVLIGAAGAAVGLLLFGFLLFATSVMRDIPPTVATADGIVVLTGGETRILEGARLLTQGRGARLLISGVNHQTKREDVYKLSGLPQRRFECCVDLGYAALDTVGNADETRKWAADNRYDSLIVVTSSYHMPRSLAEIARMMPSVELIPHPVVPKNFRHQAWWLDPLTTRILVSEYLKYIPAAAKLAAARIMRPFESSSVAAVSADGRPQS